LARDAEDFDTVTIEKVDACEDIECWPPIQKDVILQNLVTRNINSKVQHDYSSSLRDHRSIVAAVHLVADDLSILDPCIPEDSELFLQHSLFGVMFPVPDMEETTFFLEYILEKKAESFASHSVDLFNLGKLFQSIPAYIFQMSC